MPELKENPKDALEAAPSEHDVRLLDNPIWNALATEQAGLALADGRARRYPAEIGPLSGLAEQTAEAYASLGRLSGTGPGAFSAQFLAEAPVVPPGWSLIRGGLMTQMIWAGEAAPSIALQTDAAKLRPLTRDDVPAMVALAELTEPGPFRSRTPELGEFFGIFEGERLMSMAGQRLRLPGFVEVSAVCTHPEARGKGYARVAMAQVMADILARGARPMLHAFADNPAIRVYEALGFAHRRSLHLAVLQPA